MMFSHLFMALSNCPIFAWCSVSRLSSCVSVIRRPLPSSSRLARWSLQVQSRRMIHVWRRVNTRVLCKNWALMPNFPSSRFRTSWAPVMSSFLSVLKGLHTAMVSLVVMSLKFVFIASRIWLSWVRLSALSWLDLPDDQAQSCVAHLCFWKDCLDWCQGEIISFKALHS